ncbi:MAG: Bifunctional GMP synthase/glutamine amidotransferase protein [Streptococcus sp. DORA_10]|nr:MAG: Bifunctional GMP synthase/glutamine amidotransferase protein [Streptococcus sp. DORA_10]
MKNRFFYYQLLDEREEQLMNKAGVESFYISIAFLLLSYMIAVLAPSLFNPRMILIIIIIGTFYFFNRARYLGVTYYSRFHFTILGCFLLTLAITTLLMLQNYQFNIEIYQHNPLNAKYLSAWAITYVIYLPWVFIGNLGLKSYGEWAQKKFEQDMDELESGE